MKTAFYSILVGFSCAAFVFSQTRSQFEDSPITDRGWAGIEIGDSLERVGELLGKPTRFGRGGNVIFASYAFENILYCYLAETKRLGAIYFSYSIDRKAGHTISLLKTGKGITWTSTQDDVLRLYGSPKKVRVSSPDRVLYYDRMQFRFRHQKLFSICTHDGGDWS